MMKSFRQIFFTVAMVVGLALTASAQKDDQKPRPPKPDPPKIEPKEDKRPRPPKDPKKPGFAFALIVEGRSDEAI